MNRAVGTAIVLLAVGPLGTQGCRDVPAQGALDDAGGTPADALPSPPVELGRHNVQIVSSRQVIPGGGLPSSVEAQNSNNNLDVVRHQGRVYLAWRTGPDHYASADATIYVVSSLDEQSWRYEAKFTIGTDLREPRFLSLGSALFLHVSRLGTNPNAFEPKGMSVASLESEGTWSALTETYEPGFIGWRSKVERGKPYLIGYFGGEHIYDFSLKPLDVALLTTDDGRSWRPVGSSATILHGGGSETDFAIGDDGTWFGVSRNEAGDETGFGSHVCRATAQAPAAWKCKHDPRKYDSPLMFWYDGEAYLLARRNVTDSGAYDLGPGAVDGGYTLPAQSVRNQIDYKVQRKRCSIWRYVQPDDRVAFVTDLPSRGDTCFPGLIAGTNPGEFLVYNYSNDPSGDDLSWGLGQAAATNIYRHELKFSVR
jgi:hypothetical protein